MAGDILVPNDAEIFVVAEPPSVVQIIDRNQAHRIRVERVVDGICQGFWDPIPLYAVILYPYRAVTDLSRVQFPQESRLVGADADQFPVFFFEMLVEVAVRSILVKNPTGGMSPVPDSERYQQTTFCKNPSAYCASPHG